MLDMFILDRKNILLGK